jgi:hypothetical protein
MVDEREVAIEVPVYRRHTCDPEKVAAWLDYQEQMAALDHKRPKDQQGQQNLRDMARNRERLATKELAEKRKCPRCDAKRSDPCMNLTERRKGNLDVVTLWPHPERIALATQG